MTHDSGPARVAGAPVLGTACAGCDAQVSIDLSAGTAVAADGRTSALHYSDPFIVVWDCPTCRFPNADEPPLG